MSAVMVDVLTGAFTKAAFEGQLQKAVAQAHRDRQPLSVLHVDVDELLELNDLAGRDRADALLSEVVSLIAAALEEQAPIGRVEGGAFAAFRLGWDAAMAEAAAQRLRTRVHALTASGRTLTVSVGIAELRDAEPYGNLLEAAAEAATRAKQAGRDAVVCR